ncbi:MAG: phage/plasmid primase, P4 family, partial [Candidatus Bathyarchaeia archaeon]
MEKEFDPGSAGDPGPSGRYSGLGREELWGELRERDSLIRGLVEGRLEEERLRPVESSILVDPGYIFEDGRFWAVRLADEIVGQLPEGFLVTPVTRRGGDVIWRYDEGRGVFRPDGIPWVYTRVKGILGDENASSRMSETVKQIMVETYDFGDSLRREHSLNIVVVENGALDIFTGELHPFSPLYRAKNRLPVRYDPEAECPEFRRFLGEVHHPGDLAFIQEWWGYHLYREYRYHKAVMFMGEGMNGKSTELNALQRFLGEENTSSETLYSLVSNRFSPGNLYGKLANIAPDLAPDEIRRTGPFKALTGNDRIRGEHKFEQPFQFRNHAKLSFSCNQMPTTPDNTQAFFRRWEIINFPNTFTEGDPDKLEKITTPEELSGILNWALEGLHRLLEEGGFTRTRSTEEIASEWREKSNPVRSFHENCLRKDPDGVTPKDVMYHAYSSYCRARGFTKEIKQQLTVKLKEVEPLLKEGRRTLPGYEKRTTCWLGTTL